jgi:hypothetical protein
MGTSTSVAAGRRRLWLLVYALATVGGVALFLTTAVVKFGDVAESDRLRAEGVPVQATVVGESPKTTRNKVSEISYEVLGRTYTRKIGGEFPTKTLTVYVDWEEPSAFVAENGRTDQSRHPFNTWAGMPWGIVVAIAGLLGFRKDRRENAKAGRPRAPARPTRLDPR